jgi:hypothetical protein
LPLGYTPHPETNRYPSLMPAHIADAPDRTHEIRFEHLAEMHDVLTEIEKHVAWLKPRCVLFFATGGYPIVLPLLHRLSRRGHHDLLDGRVFHMFPGLSWEGSIGDHRPELYLAAELEPILSAPSPHGGNAIVAIDTTNSGNAVNLAVKAIHAACGQAGLIDPEIYVLGIVNGDKAEKKESAERIRLRPDADPSRGVYILAPSDFAPKGDVVSGRLTEFRSKSGEQPAIRIAYWLVDKIFTEDVIDLIGAAAIRDKLSVKGEGGAGRLVIRHSDEVATRETGYGAIARRLMSLLEARRDSGAWATLEGNAEYARDPVEDEEQSRMARETGGTFFRWFELDRNPEASIDHIAVGKRSGLPDEDTIRWLVTRLPASAKAAPKVVAALKKAADDAGIVAAALAFLRGAYPDNAAEEPTGLDDAQAGGWWIARYVGRKKR